MPENGAPKSLAVLIDADNTSARYAQAIFEEIVTLGEANVRRIYGDFSKSQLAGWDGAIKSLGDPAKPAAQQHERQERLRHRARHRRDGPDAQGHARRFLPDQLGQ